MTTWFSRTRSIEMQRVERFTGEGAYHGSTKQKPASAPRPPGEVVAEARPTTLECMREAGQKKIGSFDARYANPLRLISQLDVPTQEEVRDDGVTFCWCPFEEALQVAGPLSKRVLLGMRAGLTGRKRYTYIDSKIQYFEVGDLAVDSCLWHVDGSIAVRDERVLPFGRSVLHDLRARLEHDDPPLYLAYQSSEHCATEFLERPITLRLPELVPNFGGFDAVVQAAGATKLAHPAGAILGYNGHTIHRAIQAIASGWRLWMRCTETDVEIHPSSAIIDCYGTVFRQQR